MMSQLSMEQNTNATFSLEGSRANRSLLAENVSEMVMSVFYGTRCYASLVNRSQNGFWERMSTDCLRLMEVEPLDGLSTTWMRLGTAWGGLASGLERWEAGTYGQGCSLLPTPTSSDATTHDRDMIRYDSLTSFLHRICGPGPVNPRFLEEIMGFPTGWTDLEHSETP